MTPTICSDKNPQLRRSLKCIRTQNTAQMPLSSSSIINYVANGSSSTTLRLHTNSAFHQAKSNNHNNNVSVITSTNARSQDAVNNNSALSLSVSRDNIWPQQSSQTNDPHSRQHQSSSLSPSSTSSSPHYMHTDDENDNCENENVSTTSTTYNIYSPSTTVDSMNSDSIDANDAEVHSIISSKCDLSYKSEVASRLPLKTVFNVQQRQQQQQTDSNNNNNNRFQTLRNLYEIKNSEGLLAIAIKTINLVKRNQMLQRRLTELQMETSEFIKSVLANPENVHFSNKIRTAAVTGQQKHLEQVQIPKPTKEVV